MDAKKCILGTIVGGITMFVVGYLVFNLLLGGFYAQNMGSATGVTRDPLMYWALGVGCLGEAALITYALGARSGAGAGVKVGAVVGLLMWLAVDFIMYASTNISNLTITLVDPLVSAVVGAVTGAVIGLVSGKPQPA
jgi:hypothetical protein